jgi:hypothetical protein
MSDFEFEGRLERLFSQPPRVADPEAFVRRVEARLEREWTLRRLFIGAAGAVGAAITLGQTLGSGVFSRLEAFAGPAGEELTRRAASFNLETLMGDQMIWTGEALWSIAVLAGLAAAFAATRWAEAL